MPSFLWKTLVFLLVALGAPVAHAHAIGFSRGVYRVTESGLTAELVLARADLGAAVPELDRNRNGDVDADELALAPRELQTWFVSNLQVEAGTRSCSGVLERVALTDQDGLGVELRYRCANGGGAETTLTLAFLDLLSYGHRHTAHLVSGPSARDEICFGSQSRLTLPPLPTSHAAEAESSASLLFGFVRMGFEHILTGYDHIVFLLALLLTARRIRPLVLMVTAFTLGHSLSLALLVFDVVSAPPTLVEPAIALSVAYVGVENLWDRRAEAKDPERRWLITFPFGLIHGLGFAGALREVALPRAELPAALVTFNLGVEFGQLALLCVFLPALSWLRRCDWFGRRAVPALSAAVVVAGVVWFIARVGLHAPTFHG